MVDWRAGKIMADNLSRGPHLAESRLGECVFCRLGFRGSGRY